MSFLEDVGIFEGSVGLMMLRLLLLSLPSQNMPSAGGIGKGSSEVVVSPADLSSGQVG